MARKYTKVEGLTDEVIRGRKVAGETGMPWAWQLYQNGEKLFLTPEEEKQAEMEQTAALESDVREGMIAEYLNTLLPEDWDKMDLAERRGFLRGDQFTGGNRTGTIQRTTVCAVEIWAEC